MALAPGECQSALDQSATGVSIYRRRWCMSSRSAVKDNGSGRFGPLAGTPCPPGCCKSHHNQCATDGPEARCGSSFHLFSFWSLSWAYVSSVGARMVGIASVQVCLRVGVDRCIGWCIECIDKSRSTQVQSVVCRQPHTVLHDTVSTWAG